MVSSLLFRETFGVSVTNELLLAGRKLSAEDAHHLRLVSKVLPNAAELRQEGLKVAREMLSFPLATKTLPLYKSMQKPSGRMNLVRSTHELEQEVLTSRFKSGETAEAVLLFLERQREEKAAKQKASKL